MTRSSSESDNEEPEPSLALVIVRAARPLLRGLQLQPKIAPYSCRELKRVAPTSPKLCWQLHTSFGLWACAGILYYKSCEGIQWIATRILGERKATLGEDNGYRYDRQLGRAPSHTQVVNTLKRRGSAAQ
eukprot:4549709-Amphidinium_carterae.2